MVIISLIKLKEEKMIDETNLYLLYRQALTDYIASQQLKAFTITLPDCHLIEQRSLDKFNKATQLPVLVG